MILLNVKIDGFLNKSGILEEYEMATKSVKKRILKPMTCKKPI